MVQTLQGRLLLLGCFLGHAKPHKLHCDFRVTEEYLAKQQAGDWSNGCGARLVSAGKPSVSVEVTHSGLSKLMHNELNYCVV